MSAESVYQKLIDAKKVLADQEAIICPQVIALQQQIGELKSTLTPARNEILKWEDQAAEEISIAKNIASAGHLAFGDWECNDSPIKVCVYNWKTDGAHDSCIYCGEPEERK